MYTLNGRDSLKLINKKNSKIFAFFNEDLNSIITLKILKKDSEKQVELFPKHYRSISTDADILEFFPKENSIKVPIDIWIIPNKTCDTSSTYYTTNNNIVDFTVKYKKQGINACVFSPSLLKPSSIDYGILNSTGSIIQYTEDGKQYTFSNFDRPNMKMKPHFVRFLANESKGFYYKGTTNDSTYFKACHSSKVLGLTIDGKGYVEPKLLDGESLFDQCGIFNSGLFYNSSAISVIFNITLLIFVPVVLVFSIILIICGKRTEKLVAEKQALENSICPDNESDENQDVILDFDDVQ